MADLKASLTKVAAKRAAYKEATAAITSPTASSTVYAGASSRPFVFAGSGAFIARADAAATLSKEQAAIDREVRKLCADIEKQLG